MPTIQMQPLHVFAPIERVDEETRTVTAYAFVNETVDGEGGVRLRRQAMIDATPDYMQWANIRRMHQQDAVGVAQSVVWDEKGALMTLRVEDDDAWRKVKAGVYKGLSVGVLPRVMRGKDVTACKWYETSLADRPKDTACTFPVSRAEGVDPEAAVDVEVEEEPEERVEAVEETATPEVTESEPETITEPEQRSEPAPETLPLPAEWTPEQVTEFRAEWDRATQEPNALLAVLRALDSTTAPARENLEGPQGDTHYSCGAGSDAYCHGHTTRGGAQECMDRQAQGHEAHISALEEHLSGLKAKRRAELGEADLPDPATAPASELLTRVEALPAAALPVLLTRLEAAESGLATEQQARLAAEERAEKLANEPFPSRPAKFTAVERTFHTNGARPDQTQFLAELKRVEAEGVAAAKAGDAKTAERCYFRLQELKTNAQLSQFAGEE